MINEVEVYRVRNVNDALTRLRSEMLDPRRDMKWRLIAPRGLATAEHRGPVITEYREPTERVLWSPLRDANPFFHLMESLWVLAGRRDVKFLVEFNKGMADFSDNGNTFHAPYGDRLRNWFDGENRLDQIETAVKLLSANHDTRQVVMSIWDPAQDLGVGSKDIPCNDLIMLKIREGALEMTVSCRSNDAIWGAYGSNVVQFSMLQEFIAGAVGVEVGVYRQVSDSFHVYTEQKAWLKVLNGPAYRIDPYLDIGVSPYPLFRGIPSENWRAWLMACEDFCDERVVDVNFFVDVAGPMRKAWRIYKDDTTGTKEQRALAAIEHLEHGMPSCDWQLAGIRWMARRLDGGEV